jgi:hypothetical protein
MPEWNKTRLTALATAVFALPLTGCITVKPPDKPIEVNLNIDITQEVLVRLQEDVEQIIRENPDAFPTRPDL